MSDNIYKGFLGEKIAIEELVKKGYTILEKNWRFNHLEIDIIASHHQTLVIIEVKLRANDGFGTPEQFVSKQKQKNLIKAAQHYITTKNIGLETRFDVIAIIKSETNLIIDHIENAFQPGY